MYGKESNTENVHFRDEAHNYGISKRIAMYEFMSKHLGLDIVAVKNKKTGKIDESGVTIEPIEALLVFSKEGLPRGAVHGMAAVRDQLKSVQ